MEMAKEGARDRDSLGTHPCVHLAPRGRHPGKGERGMWGQCACTCTRAARGRQQEGETAGGGDGRRGRGRRGASC